MFYNQDRKNVTQLIPNHVWKVVYANYKLKFLTSIFQKESLKNRLQNTLKELKANTTNEEGVERVVLQSD
jgi:hypothetical protein